MCESVDSRAERAARPEGARNLPRGRGPASHRRRPTRSLPLTPSLSPSLTLPQVTGTVFRVDNRGAYIDVGGKSAAFCPTSELSLSPVAHAEDVISAGQAREFYVIRGEGYGELTVSIKALEVEVVWNKLRDMMADETTLSASVVAVNRGGVLVDVQGIRAFCPGSQLSRRVPNFEQLIGQELDFKIIECDPEKNRLMLSNKRAVTTASVDPDFNRTIGIYNNSLSSPTMTQISVTAIGGAAEFGETYGVFNNQNSSPTMTDLNATAYSEVPAPPTAVVTAVNNSEASDATMHDVSATASSAGVATAVVNKRAGGMGLISGRKAFQRPMKEGAQLLNAIQDVYLNTDVTIA